MNVKFEARFSKDLRRIKDGGLLKRIKELIDFQVVTDGTIRCTGEVRSVAPEWYDPLHERGTIRCTGVVRPVAPERYDPLHERGTIRCTGEVQVVAREWNRQPGEGQPKIAR